MSSRLLLERHTPAMTLLRVAATVGIRQDMMDDRVCTIPFQGYVTDVRLCKVQKLGQRAV